MGFLTQDVRFGLRMLRKSPGATLVAVLSLALGIGATTAIFTIINAVLLRPLPFRDPSSLVVIWEQNQKRNIKEFEAAPPNFRDWTERSHSFTALCGLRQLPATMLGAGQPERLEIARVSPCLFDMLGIRATYGRSFLPEDGDPSHAQVAVLSYGLWQRRFGGERSVLNRTVTLDGATYTIVGIAQPGVKLLNTASELWIPYVLDSKELAERGFHTLKVFGRLAPNVTIQQAESEMTSIATSLAAEYPDMNANWTVDVVGLREQMTGGLQQPLWILMGAVGLVLLIACSNVASILLMKAGARQKELVIRTALGASPWRVLRQMLAESVILSLVAAALGIGLAWIGTRLLGRITPPSIAELHDLSMDWRVLLFALVVGVLTGIVFGLVPGVSAMRTNLNNMLRASGRSGMVSLGWGRMRSTLVIGELMLAQLLLIGSGLLIHSLIELRNVPLGFRPDHVVSARVSLPDTRYKDLNVGRFYQRLLERVSVLPGVQHAAVTRDLPLSGVNPSLNFEIDGRAPQQSSEQPRARFRSASAGYFEALGIGLAQGRTFDRSDSDHTQPVAVINETLANREWPQASPLGRRIRSGFDGSPWCTIIGVVKDVRHGAIDAIADGEIYYHYLQVPPALMNFTENTMTIALRTEREPHQMIGSLRRELAALDSELALYDVRTADELISNSVAQPRFRTLLLAIFAASALVLASIGLYGLLASSVMQRMNELGIRAALGASVSDLLRMIVSEGLVLAAVGVAIGVALGLVGARLLEKILFGVTPRDWAAFTITPVVLLLIAALASFVPALRAARVDPAEALRDQ